MRAYVAGHTGMLGSAIVRCLKARGHSIVNTHYRTELLDKREVDATFAYHEPDYVFMAAGRVGGIQANLDNQAAFLVDNARMAMNVIDACAEYGVKLCYIGSSCMYPRECPQPMREDMLLTGSFEPTNEGYALAKMVGLKYAQWRLPDSVCAIPCNLYGPGDHYDERTSHVFPALIKKFVDAVENGDTSVPLWGSGSAQREFLHVDDCADALVTLMEREITGVINIGSGQEMSVATLAHLIGNIAGYRRQYLWDFAKPDGMPRKLMDNSRLQELGWRYKIDIREGIQRTIADYKAIKERV